MFDQAMSHTKLSPPSILLAPLIASHAYSTNDFLRNTVGSHGNALCGVSCDPYGDMRFVRVFGVRRATHEQEFAHLVLRTTPTVARIYASNDEPRIDVDRFLSFINVLLRIPTSYATYR